MLFDRTKTYRRVAGEKLFSRFWLDLGLLSDWITIIQNPIGLQKDWQSYWLYTLFCIILREGMSKQNDLQGEDIAILLAIFYFAMLFVRVVYSSIWR